MIHDVFMTNTVVAIISLPILFVPILSYWLTPASTLAFVDLLGINAVLFVPRFMDGPIPRSSQ